MTVAQASSSTTSRGVGSAILAATLFGIIFYISGVLNVAAEVVFAVRIVVTLAFFLGAAVVHAGARESLRAAWTAVTRTPLIFPAFLTLSALLGLQLWLFSWAPMHGRGLEASLGFLLLPLVMVLGARLVLRSEVTAGQWTAVSIAAVAVLLKVVLAPQTTWVTFVVCLGFPAYFVLRRRLGIDGPMAFGLEIAAVTPVAIALVFFTDAAAPQRPDQVLALLAVGIAGTGAMVAYLAASRLLSLPLFGLLGYLEPVGLVAVALVLGEKLRLDDVITYSLLTVSLAVLAIEGYRVAASRTEPA